MFDTIIYGGTAVFEDGAVHAGIGVKDGKIAAVGELSGEEALRYVDARGCCLLPGAVDCHAHLNDPGFTWREDFETGTAAAAAGGVTTVIDMPLQNRPPLFDKKAFDAKLAALDGRAVVDYAFWGAALDYNIDDIEELDAAGCAAYKIFLGPVSDDYRTLTHETAEKVAEKAAKFGGLIGFHAEDYDIIKGLEAKFSAEGAPTRRNFLDSRPVEAELAAVRFVLGLSERLGVRAHICHVSHPAVAELIAEAQRRGAPVTAETCMHYLIFSENELLEKGMIFKCAPPLRTEEARDALWDYVKNGVLAAICSDHSPCRADEKDEAAHGVFGAWGGISGIQSTAQLFYEYAVNRKKYPVEIMARELSANPAKIFGLYGQKGALKPGFDADIVIFDPNLEWTITEDSLLYKNKISAFAGLSGRGAPVETLVRGETVYKRGRGPLGFHGRFVKPRGKEEKR